MTSQLVQLRKAYVPDDLLSDLSRTGLPKGEAATRSPDPEQTAEFHLTLVASHEWTVPLIHQPPSASFSPKSRYPHHNEAMVHAMA